MKRMLALLLTLGLLSGMPLALAEGAEKPVILIVSFGTSYNDTREKTIDAIEEEAAAAFAGYEVRRAFTSQTIIDKLASRDGLQIDNVKQALERLVKDGVKTLIVQPTHVMNGFEYDEMVAALAPYADQFEKLSIGKPLLTSMDDCFAVIGAIAAELPEPGEKDAVVLMGHGTHHFANATYAALDYMFKDAGYPHIFVGTVEGYPDVSTVLKKVEAFGAEKVTLLPLMIVAGDHAENDMAGDEEDSWKILFKGEGYEVDTVLKGLGEYAGVRALFLEHIEAAIDGEPEQAD